MKVIDKIRNKRVPLRRGLLSWYRREARDLPWRRSTDPYHIWLSEVLLQQTRIETVIPYYQRFLAAFPTLDALATALDSDILKAWEGLGYYRRAHNLHKAAKIVCSSYGGRFPETAAELQELPGVGRYTAGAVASIAFGEPTPVLDGNVKRVLARLFNIRQSIDKAPTLQVLWEIAGALVPLKAPGDFNQALMELGACICVPRRPKCGDCPLSKHCEACSAGSPGDLPVRRKKKPVPHAEVVAGAIRKNGRYLLGRRPTGSMLGGLWEFPGGKIEAGETPQEALHRELREELGIEVEVGALLRSVSHAYSHLSVRIHLYECRHIARQPRTLYHDQLKWVLASQIERYALPTANRRFLDVL